jgi:hypothetical protein
MVQPSVLILEFMLSFVSRRVNVSHWYQQIYDILKPLTLPLMEA